MSPSLRGIQGELLKEFEIMKRNEYKNPLNPPLSGESNSEVFSQVSIIFVKGCKETRGIRQNSKRSIPSPCLDSCLRRKDASRSLISFFL